MTASHGLAGSERAALCDLFEAKGPDAPTLCSGWTTADLAAHLFVRERRPLASPGILVKPLARMTDREMARARQRLGYQGLVDRVRSGPPLWWRPLDSTVNSLEYLVHHEDVRRGEPGWEPREDPALDAAAWGILRRSAGFLARKVRGVGLELRRPDGELIVARKGAPRAVLHGAPVELLMYLEGRSGAARVTLDGDEAAVAVVRKAGFGI
jgi:uncharacterized protein (TIGR03085 family)